MKTKLNKDELEIEKHFISGNIKISKNEKQAKKTARTAATRYLSENNLLVLKLDKSEMKSIQKKASRLGITVDLFAKNIIHNFLTGNLAGI